MTEPNGFEYVIETTSQRTTSLVVRKSPNICTIIQKTAAGIVIIDLGEEAKARMLELLSAPVSREQVWLNGPREGVVHAHEKWNDFMRQSMDKVAGMPPVEEASSIKRKPGRPPKAA